MSTINAGRRPAHSPRSALLRWGACLAITTAALTGGAAGVASAAPSEASGLKPLPTCVVSRVTTGPGLRTTIKVSNHCARTVHFRIVWTPRSPSDPICHLLRPGATKSFSRPGRAAARAVGCLRSPLQTEG